MAVDSLLGSGKKEAVLGITENLLRKRPDNLGSPLPRGGSRWPALEPGRPRPRPGSARSSTTRGTTTWWARSPAPGSGWLQPVRPTPTPPWPPRPTTTRRPSRSRSRIGSARSIRHPGCGRGSTAAIQPAGRPGRPTTSARPGWRPSAGSTRLANQGRDAGRFSRGKLRRRRRQGPRPTPETPLGPLLPPAPPDRIRRPLRGRQGAGQGRADRFFGAVRLPQRLAGPRPQRAERDHQHECGRPRSTITPPLPGPADLDQVLASYQATLKAQKPDWAPRRHPDRRGRGAEAVPPGRRPRTVLPGRNRDVERRRVVRQRPQAGRRTRRRRERAQTLRTL